MILTPPCGNGAPTVCCTRRWCPWRLWRSTVALPQRWLEAFARRQDAGRSVVDHVTVTSVTYIQKPYQSRGVRLVASTYSPHRQASPPITSFFCSSVPCGKSQTLWDIMLFRSIQRLCDKMAAFIVLPLYSTGLHRLTQGGGGAN